MDVSSLIGIGDAEDLETPEGIKRLCQRINEREKQVNDNLQTLLSKKLNLETKIDSCLIKYQQLYKASICEDSKKLTSVISHTSDLAEKVSAKVRNLDTARMRATEVQKRVHDLIDLQLCSQGVMTAIKDEDYEIGARHVKRYLSMDRNILEKTADDVSSMTSVNQAVDTLEKAAKEMREIVKVKLDEAIKKNDLASVERFFKIFPQLGMYDEGIVKFTSYVCTKLSSIAEKELRQSMEIAKAEKRTQVAYADTFTNLLENVLRVIETNQPILENYYGYGHLLKMVKILQVECDDQTRRLIQEFNKNRLINRKVNQINDYIKSQSTQSSSTLGHLRKASGSMDKLNAKDLDTLIAELTIMHSRAELYVKFIKRRVTNDIEKCFAAGDMTEEEKKTALDSMESVIKKSQLSNQMQEILSTYLLFERYFMEESVIKAIGFDSHEPGQLYSSMVDDVFFIVRKCIRRSIGAQSVDGVCAVINNGGACIEQELINAFRNALKSGYHSGYIDLAQAYSAFQSTIQQGKIQTNDSEMARMKFTVTLNNADKSTEYIETLFQNISEEIKVSFPNIDSHKKEMIESCLSGLKSVGDSLKTVVESGMQQLRSSAIKPRINPWIDQFQSSNHMLTDDELAVYEAGETFIQFLIVQLDGLLNSFKKVLSEKNYDILVMMLASDVTARFERAIKKCAFDRNGGLVLDKEVRSLGTFLTGATSWTVRDKMARLTQIAIILNLEKISELSEYYDSKIQEGPFTAWRLTPNEIRNILKLRTDFKIEDIKKLQL
ncbi:conserved oligomeric Golgi complex subunit 4 [Chironomus tepperi]|uniref:conserved oligomeric Golgi complex subunit 4 n=1 Tax=Chironomus tepperi TaxID=113505 RepID=UPI00391F1EF7